jgi:AAA domain
VHFEAIQMLDPAKSLVDSAMGNNGSPDANRLTPIPWGELHLLPKLEPLIEGVIDVGTMSAIVGATGAYKTGTAIDWAGHIAIGRPWRGHSVRQGTVVYLAVEGGRGIAERFDAWRIYHNVEPRDGQVFVIPEPIDLAHNDLDTKLLLRRLSELGQVDFIAVDTTSRALAGGDENSPKDMGAFVRHCDIIRDQTGAHLSSVHHLGKDESRAARGHSLLRAALDTEITVTKSGHIGNIEITKQRDGPDSARWGFSIELINIDEGRQSYVVVPADAPPTSKANRWTRGLAIFKDAAHNAILAHGQDHRPCGDGPIVKATCVNDIRAEHNRLYVHYGSGDRAEAERKAWARALKAARDNRLVGAEHSGGRDIVWLV